MNRNINQLFRGKPKSLWGNANKKERAQYKSSRGQQKTVQRSPTLEKVFSDPAQLERLAPPRSGIDTRQYYINTFCTPSTRRLLNQFFPYSMLTCDAQDEPKSNAHKIRNPARIRTAILNYTRGDSAQLQSLLQSIESANQSIAGNSKKISAIAFTEKAVLEEPEKAATVRHTLDGIATQIVGELDSLLQKNQKSSD